MPHRHIQGNDLSPLSSQASEEVSRGQSSGFSRYCSHRFLPFHELTQILLWFHDTKEDEKEKKRIRLSQSRALQVLSRRLAGEMCSRLGASPSSCTRIKAWHPPVSDSTLGGPPYEVRDTCSDQVNKKTMVLLRDDLRLIYPISHWERKVKNIGTISINTNVHQTWMDTTITVAKSISFHHVLPQQGNVFQILFSCRCFDLTYGG